MIGDFSYKLNRVQRPLAAIADGAKRKFIHARISCLSWLKRLLFLLALAQRSYLQFLLDLFEIVLRYAVD